MDSGSTSRTGSSSDNDSGRPLWEYVTKLEKGKGGTWTFSCNFCSLKGSGSYSRVWAHLCHKSGNGITKCTKVNAADAKKFENMDREYDEKRKKAAVKPVPLPSGSSSVIEVEDDEFSTKKRRTESPITRALDVSARTQLDHMIARMFYTGGLSFNHARNPDYLRSYTFAATHNIPGYVPPGYNKLRTSLLQQEKNNVARLLEPLKGTWRDKGVSICSDGWSDPGRKPLINFMATSGKGPLFLKAVNCFGEYKDKFFIADLMKEVIGEVGDGNVVQVIIDNAPNCKAAGELIEGMYPHIFWTPCVVHTLNLALKNICSPKNTNDNVETYEQCNWISEVYGDAVQIKNFIVNHNMRSAIFNKFCPMKLLSVAETRFASVIVVLKRFKLIRRGLELMVMSDEWSSYKEDDVIKANFVKEKLVSDTWWDKLNYILDFTRPIYDMIRFCDTDKPCLHLVYEMWDSMIEKVKVEIYKREHLSSSETSPFHDVVHAILIARWTKSYTPLHCVAHSLNPRFYSEEWLLEDASRVAPHKDGEISNERNKAFRRLFQSDEDLDQVYDEFADFSLFQGPFDDLTSIAKRYSFDPRKWWATFGARTPLLQSLAVKLLGQPSSSSCCERNWSTYNFIHSLKRNKLTQSRAEELVFVHNNLRLLSRGSDQYDDKNTKMWDVGGDSFDSMENIGYLEFANLSLDEPELEDELISE